MAKVSKSTLGILSGPTSAPLEEEEEGSSRSHKLASLVTTSSAASLVISSSATSEQEIEIPIRYKRLEKIGDGATASVYKGLKLDNKEHIAVKQVRAKPNEWESEVAVLKKLSHPNIVRYLGTHRDGGVLNILMEYAPGGSVSSLLKRVGCLPEETVRQYTKEMLQGLEFVHERGIVHRDIKGANLLLDDKGSVKLADFGASKIYMMGNPDGTRSADFLSLKGTLSWMAPEVVKMTGHGRKADIWSVGITVWEMLMGRPPYVFPNVQNGIYNIGKMDRAPEAPGHVSMEARNFIGLCLKLNPNDRPKVKALLKHPFVTEPYLAGHVPRLLRAPTLEAIPSYIGQSLSMDPLPSPSPSPSGDETDDPPPPPKSCLPKFHLFGKWRKRSDSPGVSPAQSPSASGEMTWRGSHQESTQGTSKATYQATSASPSPDISPDGPLASEPVSAALAEALVANELGPSRFSKAVTTKEFTSAAFTTGIRPVPKGQFLRALPRRPARKT